MGCDIHSEFYIKYDDEIESFNYSFNSIFSEIFDYRSYVLFSLLADVRNYNDIKPIKENDDSWYKIEKQKFEKNKIIRNYYDYESFYYFDYHSFTQYTLKELIDFFEQNANNYIVLKNGETLKETYSNYYSYFYENLIKMNEEVIKLQINPENFIIRLYFDN